MPAIFLDKPLIYTAWGVFFQNADTSILEPPDRRGDPEQGTGRQEIRCEHGVDQRLHCSHCMNAELSADNLISQGTDNHGASDE